MSEPKRPLLDPSTRLQKPHSSKETHPGSERVPAAASPESAVDLFVGPPRAESDRVSLSMQEKQRSLKRKEMEADISMDELESIMSEDMDCFDEQPSVKESHQSLRLSSAKQKQDFNTAETPSASKRQRLHVEGHGADEKSQKGLEKESGLQLIHSKTADNDKIHIKTDRINPSDHSSSHNETIKPPDVPQAKTASTSKEMQPFEDDEAFKVRIQCHFVILF